MKTMMLAVGLGLLAAVSPILAQESGSVLVRVRNGVAPIPSADVHSDDVTVRSDERGEARLTLPAGEHEVTVIRAGFESATVKATVKPGEETVMVVQLREQRLEDTVTVVSSSRGATLVADEPIRIEAVPQEEIEENQSLAPGNLSTLLTELGGVRVQMTVPSLGGSELRLQGLPGRYTQVLHDDLPLYGDTPDAFTLMQAPPLDLARVELIKGTASALYGGSAIGGVMNLVSRRPGSESAGLISQSSQRATDALGFFASPASGRWGFTLLGSAHRQELFDVDGDDWGDLAGYRRATLRPRLFWDDGTGDSLLATIGAMGEDREGGTVKGGVTPAGDSFEDTLDTRRYDAGTVAQILTDRGLLVGMRGMLQRISSDRSLDDVPENEVRDTGFAEVSLAGSAHANTWTVGAAWNGERLDMRQRDDLDYRYSTPALFAQDEIGFSEKLRVAVSGRLDFQNVYGTFFDRRVSVLFRPGGGMSFRISTGTGYSLPIPITERTEEVGLRRVAPLAALDPERARSASLDVGWGHGAWELNGTLFASRVEHALQTVDSTALPGTVEVRNAPDPLQTYGSELLVRYSHGPWHAIGSYTYTHSEESDPAGSGLREAPLTPRHAGELALIVESEARGRIGGEISYVGAQSLEEDPYRSTSQAYWTINILGELRISEAHIFFNAENLTDFRQTRHDPLLLPVQSPEGTWTTDVWAPLEGRTFNAGVRLDF
ncbi:MAG TPA: TonB-dependent receptor [Candidatus Polarisedimenticolia bacterium]|nr:TonB-dependent receptor [Candidatus Polarisedimenticolia bacterium]